jgi:alginate O-acetyltransferase complex protein AlgI
MLFNSFQYLLFLPLVVALYWACGVRYRPLILLIASYYFYMSWFAAYGLLIGGLTVVNYLIGLGVAKSNAPPGYRRALFIAGILLNLGSLAFFKYANFLSESFASLLHGISIAHWNIVLPLGISFFVFEFIHYLSDVYSGNQPIKNPVRFALFAAFFPSQIAGPIKRYEDFDAQILRQKRFSSVSFNRGIALILEGMFKKVVLGDSLAVLVQRGFVSTQYLAPVDAWFAVLAFALQIYYDFSGYTDIGRGSAMLLNIELPENFNMPYLSASLIEFWRRWHMSLSFWLRDYLYKPLGGSRGGTLRQNRNLFLTMLLGGLWHGASWHFVFWGAFHGIGLVLNHAWRKLTGGSSEEGPLLARAVSILLTFVFVLLGWVLFRVDSFDQAMLMYKHMFLPISPSLQPGFLYEAFGQSFLPAAFSFYIAFQLIRFWKVKQFGNARELGQISIGERMNWRFWFSPSTAVLLASYAGFALVILCLASKKSAPFIYFQF